MNVRDLLLAGGVIEHVDALERAVWRLLRASRRWRDAADAADPSEGGPTPEQLAEFEAAVAELWAADVELEQLEPDPIVGAVH